MSRRECYEIPGVDHGGAPIPMAARVGASFRTSAIMGKDPATNTLPEDGASQVRFAFANLRALLDLAGVDLDQVVFVEVLLADDALRGEVNRHWTDWYPHPHDRPARHTTARDLGHGMKVQLRVEADLGGGPMTEDIVSRVAGFPTSGISDALDRLGINGQALGIGPLDPSLHLAGRAFTGLYQPVDVDGGTVGDYIDDVPEGAVIVLDNAGRTDATVWGDILTLVATRRAIAGTVIDGVCRDSARSRELAYPVFSRGRYMRTGKDRVQMVGVNVPVTIGRVRVRPGDILIGDGDGVVVVPRDREAEVLATAEAIEHAEAQIRAAVTGGERLSDARRRLGYHALQSVREDKEN